MFRRDFSACTSEVCTEVPDLLLEGPDAGEKGRLLKLFQCPTLRNILGAVPVEGGEVEEDEALGAAFGRNF